MDSSLHDVHCLCLCRGVWCWLVWRRARGVWFADTLCKCTGAGLEDHLGSFAPGKQFDALIINCDGGAYDTLVCAGFSPCPCLNGTVALRLVRVTACKVCEVVEVREANATPEQLIDRALANCKCPCLHLHAHLHAHLHSHLHSHSHSHPHLHMRMRMRRCRPPRMALLRAAYPHAHWSLTSSGSSTWATTGT